MHCSLLQQDANLVSLRVGAPPPPKTDPNRVSLTGAAFHNNVSLAVVLLSVHKGTTFLLLEQILSQKS